MQLTFTLHLGAPVRAVNLIVDIVHQKIALVFFEIIDRLTMICKAFCQSRNFLLGSLNIGLQSRLLAFVLAFCKLALCFFQKFLFLGNFLLGHFLFVIGFTLQAFLMILHVTRKISDMIANLLFVEVSDFEHPLSKDALCLSGRNRSINRLKHSGAKNWRLLFSEQSKKHSNLPIVLSGRAASHRSAYLTTAALWGDNAPAAQPWVAGIGVPRKAAKSRNDSRTAAFLRPVSPLLGGLDGEPQGSPVRFPGTPTRPVPPSRLESGVRLINLNESETIMTKPIKVPFHGATLYVVDHNGEPYTPLKPIVEGIGIQWHGQLEKLKANDVRWGIQVICIPSRGGKQEAACIPLRKLAGWLMTLHPSRVKPELRDKITAYQNECDDALWKYWSEGAAERRAKPGALKSAPQPVPQARAALPAGRYHYPRKMLDQPYFTSPKTGETTLNVSVLTSGTYVSPLMALLNQMRSEGHEVTAPFDEALALRKALIKSGKVLDDIQTQALLARHRSAEE